MKKLLLLILVFQASQLFAQKHALSFFVNGIQNINTYDEAIFFNKDESISLPLQPLAEYGLLYNYMIKNKPFSFFVSLVSTDNGVKIKRTYGNSTSGGSTSWNNANIRFGLTEELGLFKFSIGPGIKYIPFATSVGAGVGTFTRSRIHELRGKLHYSVYLKTSYELKKFSRNNSKLHVNFVANIGLQQIFTTVSTFTDPVSREVSRTFINNTGSFIGVGLTYSRLSDDKFKDLFKFRV